MERTQEPSVKHEQDPQEQLRRDVDRRITALFETARAQSKQSYLTPPESFPSFYGDWMNVLGLKYGADRSTIIEHPNARIFFDELLALLAHHAEENPAALQRMFEYLEDQFANIYTQQTQLLQFLPTKDLLDVGVELSKYKEITTMASGAAHALSEKLLYPETETHTAGLTDALANQRTPEQIAIILGSHFKTMSLQNQVACINFMPTLIENATDIDEPSTPLEVAYGWDPWKDPIPETTKAGVMLKAYDLFLQSCRNDPTLNVFVRAAVERPMPLEQAETETWDAYRATFARAPEPISPADTRENRMVRRLFKMKKTELPGLRLKRIAADAYAAFDDGWTVKRISDAPDVSHLQGDFVPLHQALAERMPVAVKRLTSHDTEPLLSEMYRPWMSSYLEETAGISLEALTIREQFQLFRFLLTTDASSVQETFKTTHRFGQDAARSFLACERDAHAADDILEIARHAPPEDAEKVFRTFNRITDLLRISSGDLYREIFSHGTAERPTREALDDEFVARARAVLKSYADGIRQGQSSEAQTIAERLERVETDTVLFASVFKTAFKGKSNVKFEDLRGVELSARRRDELEPETERAMLATARENWKQDPELRDLPVAALKNKLRGGEDDSRFYLLKKEDRLLAFMRFDERPDGELYAGSLNVDPDLRGSAVGEAFLSASLDRAADGRAVHADFFPQVDAGMMYVDRLGWAVTGVTSVDLPNGERLRRCDMVRQPEWQDAFPARKPNVSKEYLASLAGQEGGIFQVESFRFPAERERFMDAVEQAGRTGRVMTRYFSDPADPARRVVVFEPVPSGTRPAVSRAKPHKNSK